MTSKTVLLTDTLKHRYTIDELARILGQEIAFKSAKLEGLKEGLPLESKTREVVDVIIRDNGIMVEYLHAIASIQEDTLEKLKLIAPEWSRGQTKGE